MEEKKFCRNSERYSPRNKEDLSFSEKFVSTEDLSKKEIHKMEINNGMGNMELSEYHGKSAKSMRV